MLVNIAVAEVGARFRICPLPQTPVQLQEDPCWGKQEQMASKAVLDQEVRREGPAWASKPVLLAKATPKRPEQQVNYSQNLA